MADEFKEERERLQVKIADKKKEITSTRSLGSRHDSAKEALGRAKQRLQSAEEALELAKSARELAANEVNSIEEDIRAMRMQMTCARPESTETFVKNLSTSMVDVFNAIKADSNVSPDTIAQTEVSFTSLLSGV